MESNATVLVKKLYSSRLAVYLPWIICGLATCFYFYELCLRVALGTMVPEVRSALNISLAQIGVLSAFYYYAYTPMQIVAGTLIDRIGPRRLLIGMVLLCAVGSFAFARTHSFALAVVAQFLLGFASAFAFVGVMKLASNWFTPKYFGVIAGLTTSLGMIGAMVSNIFIAYVMHGIGWRGVWYVFGIFGLLLTTVIYLICVNHHPDKQVAKAPEVMKWGKLKKDFMSMLQSPFFWVNAIIGGLIYFPTTAFASLWGIPYMMVSYHVDKVTASTIVSMIFLGWAMGGPLAGWLSVRYISKKNLFIYGSLAALILMSLALAPYQFTKIEYGIILFAFGLVSSVEVLVFDVAAKLFNGRSAGTAASLTNFILMSVSMVLQPVIGWAISSHPTAHAYRVAMLIIPVGLLLAFIMSVFVYKEGRL